MSACNTSTPAVSAIIVTWNSADWLAESLNALTSSALFSGTELETVVVDNASVDSSVEIAYNSGVTKVISNRLNGGFAVAANQGVALSRAPWVLMVNPDLVVRLPFVGELLKAASNVGNEVATLVPDVRFSTDPSIINSRGLMVDETGIPAEIDKGLHEREMPVSEPVFGGSGGACLLRADALGRVGAFEPCYFAYVEDVDLAWRLQKAGYRSAFIASAQARHAGSSTTGVTSPTKAYLVARNRRWLFSLHGPHGGSARLRRAIAELGHASVQSISSQSVWPIRGRLAVLRQRRYRHFIRACNQGLSLPVSLAPRVSFVRALRRKQVSLARETRR